MTVLVDTSALLALLDEDDIRHRDAARYWDASRAEVVHVAHAYIVVEAVALVRRKLGWPAVDALLDGLLPAVRVEMVDRDLHDRALDAYRRERGATSFVDHVTIGYARLNNIREAFAFDRDLERGGLQFPLIEQKGEG